MNVWVTWVKDNKNKTMLDFPLLFHSGADCFQHAHVYGQVAVERKQRAIYRAVIACNVPCATKCYRTAYLLVWRSLSCINVSFISVAEFIHGGKRVGNRSILRKPSTCGPKEDHIIFKHEDSSPDRNSNPRSSIDDKDCSENRRANPCSMRSH